MLNLPGWLTLAVLLAWRRLSNLQEMLLVIRWYRGLCAVGARSEALTVFIQRTLLPLQNCGIFQWNQRGARSLRSDPTPSRCFSVSIR